MRQPLHRASGWIPAPGAGVRVVLVAVVAATAVAAAVFGTALPLASDPVPGARTSGSAGSAGSSGRDTLEIVDDRGDTLRLEGPARRIVSLIPAATEILFALGAGDRVAGRTRYGVHPPAAREVPSVGEGIRPSVEAILARRPDVVLVFAGASNRAAVGRLRDLAVPLLAVEHNTLEDLRRNVGRLGRLTGRRVEADSLAAAVDGALDRVAEVTSARPRRSVYFEVWADPPITVGAGSYLDSLITVAGGRNAFGDLSSPSPQVSLEAVAGRSPDVVVVAREEAAGGRDASPAERPGWSAVEAVRQGRVRGVDGELIGRLGPRLGEAAAALARAIHPELHGALERAGFPAGGP